MGKIRVLGKAEREYDADCCNIFMEIQATRKTADEASKECSDQCEKLLSLLKELGFPPDKVEIISDRIDDRTSYETDEITYESKKELCIKTDANMKTANAVRDIIEKGFKEISFYTRYSISNENDLNKELLQEAIQDSRDKAELLAESMDQKITGVELATLSYEDGFYEMEYEGSQNVIACVDRNTYSRPLTDQLKPEKKKLSAEVSIEWLSE